MRSRVWTAGTAPKKRRTRSLTGILSILALCAAALVSVGAAPVQAVQATGEDVPAWNTGWNWTWATTFRYQADGTDVTINETVNYAVTGREIFAGHEAYKLNISGTITSGSGTVAVDGVGNANLSNFSGNVSGTRYVRVSDLALLREHQVQDMAAKAQVGIISQNITAHIDLKLTPNPSWKVHDFPLNAGDSWTTDTDIEYEGGFSYDAGSLGGSGSSPFGPDTLPFYAPSVVTNETINVPIASNLNTKKVSTVTADGSMSDLSWWSPTHKNQAKEILVLPLDGAKLTLTRNMSAASIPSGPQFSATATPSLTCAGGTVTIAGTLSTNASGVPVTVKLDQSQINPGQFVSATTTTGANGTYSATVTVPSDSDGLAKVGSRANWGVSVTSPAVAAVGATTVVVTPVNCSTIAYTGAVSGPVSGSAAVSAQLSDLATPAGAAGRLVTFTLAGGGSVSATTNASGVATATLPMNGPVRTTTVTASYAGSANLAAAQSTSAFAVTVNPTSTSVVASASQPTIGDAVSFTASVTPQVGSGPTGGVQFLVDGNAFGAPVPLSGGSATSPNISTLALGDHVVQAVYNGSATFGTSTSPAITITVRVPRLPSSTSVSVAPSTAVYGQPVTLSSTVGTTSGSGSPTGEVTFTSGGNVLGTVAVDGSGSAELSTGAVPVGSHNVVATYTGDDEYNGSSSAPTSLVVSRADVDVVLLSSNPTPVSGEAVDFTLDVTAQAPGEGVPGGTAQLRIDGVDVGDPVALTGGSATFDPVSTLLAGNHTVAVAYSGDANFKSGSDSVAETVGKAATTATVMVSPSPSAEGQAVTVTANLTAVAPGSGTPTGTVVFTVDGNTLGAAPLVAGSGGSQATIVESELAPGSYQVVATYAGDAAYEGSESSPVSHTVIAGAAVVATTTTVESSSNPSTYGELIAFTAQVVADDESAPSGAVQFSVDGTDIGDPVEVGPDGTAVSPLLASPAPGDHTVIAAFVPNPGYAASGAITTQTVSDAGVAVTLTSSDASSDYGQGVTFDAAVTSVADGVGGPTGFVQFRVDGAALGGAVELVDGAATSPSIATLAPGDHTVTATYSGDPYFTPEIVAITQAVAKVATGTTLTASPASSTFGQSVTLTATVTPASSALGSPGGTVSFVEGSTTLATVAVAPDGGNGTASFTTSGFGGGAHGIRAVYSGTAIFAGSESTTTTVTVAKRATSMYADAAVIRILPPLALPLGQLRITLTSANGPVAGVPVVFTIGAATACTSTTDAAGVATCSATNQLLSLILFNGYKATFAGNADYLGTSAVGVVLK